MSFLISIHPAGDCSIVEFLTDSLMDRREMEQIWWDLVDAIDERGVHRLVLNFQRVEFLSSQAIGIVMALHNKLGRLPDSALVLFGVNRRLMELLDLVGLTPVLNIQASLAEAIRSAAPVILE